MPELEEYRQGLALTGDLPGDAGSFLARKGFPKTALHCQQVAETARLLAVRFHASPEKASGAGWLHDISAVLPGSQRLAAARAFSLDILVEEAQFPLLLHQKLSAVLARDWFAITDAEILGAIGCHTTLKPRAVRLDLVLFVADKLSWDQAGEPPYSDALKSALEHSLESAALVYIRWLVENRASLPGPLHPWLLGAKAELEAGQRLSR